MTDTRPLGRHQRGHRPRRAALPVSTLARRHLTVTDHATWERLCAMAGAVHGSWEPRSGTGWVFFGTVEGAEQAQREIS